MNADNIQLLILPERPVIRNDDKSECDLVVEVRTKPASAASSALKNALNLCIVLDRSGSMQGVKLETAKRSCLDILNRLGKDDLFTLVVFDDAASVVINPQTPQSIASEMIAKVTTGGSTNLSLGWYLGLLELQTHATPHHNNRLLLLSDGQANQGETKRATLANEASKARELGISTSTIGIGEDFQEDILEAIANESGGRFWYIRESKIEDIIEEEFEGSLSVVLDRPRLELILPPGVIVSKELNTLSKVSGRYRLRPLKGTDTFNLAVRLACSPSEISGASLPIRCILYDGDRPVSDGREVVGLVPPEQFVIADLNPLVRSVVQQYEMSAANEVVSQKMAEGDFDLLKKMLIEEVDGMRRVRDALADSHEAENEVERFRMELLHLGADMDVKAASAEVLELMKAFAGTPEVHDFFRRWQKVMMYERHRMAGRHHEVGRFDDDAYRDLLDNAKDLVETLAQRYPARANELVECRRKLSERMARRE